MSHLQTQLELVTEAAQALGYPRVNPESLAALRQNAVENGWASVARPIGREARDLSRAFDDVMAGFRALLAPC